MVIETGNTGKPLRDIIAKLGNKSYPYIECRCKWTHNGEKYDEFWGVCVYDNETKELKSIDGDSYSLDDLYESYKEWVNTNGQLCLTIWECGIIE